MDNALFKRISAAMTRAEKKAEKRKGRKLTPDQTEAIDEQVCLKYGVTGDDFFLACMEHAVV
jgi:hypothetical protein